MCLPQFDVSAAPILLGYCESSYPTMSEAQARRRQPAAASFQCGRLDYDCSRPAWPDTIHSPHGLRGLLGSSGELLALGQPGPGLSRGHHTQGKSMDVVGLRKTL
ncbi:uncharacterized protein BDCG_07173 [Blastomyces dermatitidis ER-3]|uniref:Uncharacterized protein n=2 Tax=Ajellomyces dermatitidis TaxID=5039 RepID=F2T616_AJEDA|nr:uncharacterized protein BDCG_07173 [Blastomyces dermatitidis ER-3]EEQ92053.1 hypothetical protein BDCG_07173 [Blastomyces dermatitidis ER-3]EGE78679.1 hypothetical protein BDDG_01616 [Blastomyces dermatitidis ATCC 18188]EQL35346.1 hypothetical protein BDFG_02857 [Blastomyces dermatitidis ATCC 26199]